MDEMKYNINQMEDIQSYKESNLKKYKTEIENNYEGEQEQWEKDVENMKKEIAKLKTKLIQNKRQQKEEEQKKKNERKMNKKKKKVRKMKKKTEKQISFSSKRQHKDDDDDDEEYVDEEKQEEEEQTEENYLQKRAKPQQKDKQKGQLTQEQDQDQETEKIMDEDEEKKTEKVMDVDNEKNTDKVMDGSVETKTKPKHKIKRTSNNLKKNGNGKKNKKFKIHVAAAKNVYDWIDENQTEQETDLSKDISLLSINRKRNRSDDDSDLQIIENPAKKQKIDVRNEQQHDDDNDEGDDDDDDDDDDDNANRFKVCKKIFWNIFGTTKHQILEMFIYSSIMSLKSKDYNKEMKEKLIKALLQDKLVHNATENKNTNINDFMIQQELYFELNSNYIDEYNDKKM